jgi:hypothetical protein
MEETFEAIGLDVASRKAFNHLAERAGSCGEPTRLQRRGATLHGRCWKLGDGLEVWTVLYESGTGEIFYADCRPGFRARYTQRISPWALTEYDEEGEAIVHGYCDNSETEVLFELQNLTEVGAGGFNAAALSVGLCGLAYRARVVSERRGKGGATNSVWWKPLEKVEPARAAHENDWSLCGRVLAFKPLRNPLSGSDLFWVYLDLESFKLEVLINHRALRGALKIGARVAAEIWLQGHVLDARALESRYEGVDRAVTTAEMWSRLRRKN